MVEHEGPFWSLYQELKTGKVSRREFIARATMLGVGLPVTLFVLNAINVQGADAASGGVRKRLSGRNQAADGRPSEGTDGQTRGAGGEVKLLQWQAATLASLHKSTGTKDTLAASLVTEPLLSYLADGTLVPTLAAEVPSIENGMLAADLSSVTYKLREGVLWSDGTPFTSSDVAFTWQWITDRANQSINVVTYSVIKSIDTPDDLTAVITFNSPQLGWYIPFSGTYLGAVYPKHILEGGPEKHDAFAQNPIGTGPYKIDSFKASDQVIYVINENYREANKPFFATVNLKGGGDPTSAAQAVLQTGDWDFAWNLQVEPQVLNQMIESGGKGTVHVGPASDLERVLINFSDPNVEVNGERSQKDTPHPFFSDKAVRQALALGADRQTMSDQFYLGAPGEPPGVNALSGVSPTLESTNTTWEYNLDKANQVLEEAGWVKDGDYRKKGDVELKITYSTSINSVRQKNQAVNKQNWEAIGFKVQLKQVDSGIFFDSSAGNDQNAQHFFSDLLMYTNGPSSAFPLSYMQSWYGGKDGANISQKANGWSGVNESRYHNPDYDALYDSLSIETDLEKAAETFIKMNDIVINDFVIVPLVARGNPKYGISNKLRNENISGSLFEALYSNIANWNDAPTS